MKNVMKLMAGLALMMNLITPAFSNEGAPFDAQASAEDGGNCWAAYDSCTPAEAEMKSIAARKCIAPEKAVQLSETAYLEGYRVEGRKCFSTCTASAQFRCE